MYFLVNEYDMKFLLPPPLVIFYNLYLAIRTIYEVGKKEAFTLEIATLCNPMDERFSNVTS